MPKQIFSLSISLFLVGLLAAQKTTAITCGQVLNTRTGEILRNQIIYIKGNLIESISPAAGFELKADTTIDLSVYTVLPGLIDCHTHVLLQGNTINGDYDAQLLKESIPYRTIRAVRSAKQSLMNGFTTIRDLGTEGAGYADADIKKAINKGEIEGPRMHISTLAINTTGHYALWESLYSWELKMPKGLQEITGADEGRRAVREQIAHGADWIKIYADRGYSRQADGSYHSLVNFTEEEIKAIGDETLRSNRKLCAHAETPEGIIASIEAGARSIEHGYGMNDTCIQLMVRKKVYWCPTISIYHYLAEMFAKNGNSINLMYNQSEPDLFKKALKAGVKIAYGTDIGGYNWRESQAKDFSFMVSYGMTNLEAIQTATINAAELLGQSQKIGEIKAGAYADLIALKADPTKDISVLEDVKWVMKDGAVKK